MECHLITTNNQLVWRILHFAILQQRHYYSLSQNHVVDYPTIDVVMNDELSLGEHDWAAPTKTVILLCFVGASLRVCPRRNGIDGLPIRPKRRTILCPSCLKCSYMNK